MEANRQGHLEYSWLHVDVNEEKISQMQQSSKLLLPRWVILGQIQEMDTTLRADSLRLLALE